MIQVKRSIETVGRAIGDRILGMKSGLSYAASLSKGLSSYKLAFLLAVIGIAGWTVAVIYPQHTDAQSTSSDADYTGVRNALEGVTHLLRQDDMTVNFGISDTSYPLYYASSLSSISTSGSNGTQNFDGFEIPGTCDQCSYGTLYRASDTTTVAGRFFLTLQDTVVSYPSRRNSEDLVDIVTGNKNANGNASYYWNTSQQLPYSVDDDSIVSRGYAADFNGDGYDELLMTYGDVNNRFAGNARIRIATAQNINNGSLGFNYGAEQVLNIPDASFATAIGDFNGDGQPEIAVVSVGIDNKLTLFVYAVNPQTLAITFKSQQHVDDLSSNSMWQPTIQLVAGKFTDSPNDQLVVANPSGTHNYTALRIFDFAEDSYQPVLKQTYDSGATATNTKLLTSKFDWGSPYDAISFMQTTTAVRQSKSFVYIIAVDPASYSMTKAETVDVAHRWGLQYGSELATSLVALDITVGNFNNLKPNPADPSQKINDPDLQLAVATGIDWGTSTNQHRNYLLGAVNTVQVIDQSNGSMSLSDLSTIQVTPPGGKGTFFNNLTISSTDLQGRSLRLGGGYKIAIDKSSPSLIVAQPPLHVDWAPQSLSNSSPTVLNLSYAYDRFNSSFTSSNTTTNATSYSKTTGWGFAGKESAGYSFSLGQISESGDLENGIKASETFTAQQDLNHSTEHTHGGSQTTNHSITQTTGANDYLWVEDDISYLYVYDVIGQKTCPDDIPNCAEYQKIPLTLMMSAPGPKSTPEYISAESLEWYQPVWENGNVLSYPANTAQLLKYMDSQTTVFGTGSQRTDTTSTSFTTTWAATQSQGLNIGKSRVFKEDSDSSVQGVASDVVMGFGGTETVALNFDFGGSDSIDKMRTSSTTIDQSTGMTIQKSVNFLDANTYGYNFSAVIFGKTMPLNYFDGTDPKTPGSGLPSVNDDLTIFGPMRSAFTVDPLANGQGGWWTHSYSAAPDLALNHPNRWSKVKGSENIPLPTNCVDSNDGYADCAFQQLREPADPWDDSFHSMRGFFIFKAGEADPNDPYNQGMQQQYATVGDQMSLQARVYNYSLKAMPAGTQVKVRFYGMPWDVTAGVPADYISQSQPGGSSFLIGETILSPISNWNNNTDTPNYSIANVNFDTTGHADQDLVFWVVVWMEDSTGNLVQELPGKGLSARPSALVLPSFYQMTGLEPTVTNLWKSADTDPDVTSFSNNIGFYKQAFHVASKGTTVLKSGSLRQPTKSQRGQLGVISLNDSGIRQLSINQGQSVEVFTTLRNESKSEGATGLSVKFYNGNPSEGGKLFDIERLANIRPISDHKVRTRFTPETCGMHDIYIRVTQSGVLGDIEAVPTQLRVKCSIPLSEKPEPITGMLTLSGGQVDKNEFVPVTAQLSVSSKSDPRPDIELLSITQPGIGDSKNDVAEAEFGTDDRDFLLRSGTPTEPRLYKVVYSVMNWKGNEQLFEAFITLGPDSTSSAVSVSGKVADGNGRGVSRAVVTITDSVGNKRQAVTNTFGNFRISDVPSGFAYTLSASERRHTFPSQVLNVNSNLTGITVVASQ